MLAALLGCSSDDSNLQGAENPPPEVTADSIEIVKYEVEMETFSTDEEVKETRFKSPQTLSDKQEVQLSFKFNSKNNTKFQLMQTSTSFSCGDGTPELSYSLVKVGEAEEVIKAELTTLGKHKVEMNADYLVRVTSKPLACGNFEIGLISWLGDEFTNPSIVRNCIIASEEFSPGGPYHHLVDRYPVWVYKISNQKIFGQNTVCGEKLTGVNLGCRINRRGSSICNVDSDSGKYSYTIQYAPDLKSGLYSCSKDGEVFSKATMNECIEKVMNQDSFPL